MTGIITKTVTIGKQIWMAENLKTTRLKDGTPIPVTNENDSWIKLTAPSYCWYFNDEKENKNVYGGLYNWYAVNSNKLCPEGWHVPTENDWNPANWNPIIKEELKNRSPKETILTQLTELAENYGEIYEFWMDMQCWADTSLTTQEIYNLLKSKAPKALVHFNQHVQDGTKITYFPTDILNGEERIPPAEGHKALREVGNATYYLPFEYEITSQRCDSRTLGHGLMEGSVWFTYYDSHFYPVDSLYKYIKQNYERGGSNILLSTAPDVTGCYRKADQDSIIKLGNLIWQRK